MSDRWQRIEQIYHSTRERKQHERAAYLNEVCAGDDALRQEVESLLFHEKGAKGFLDAPAIQIAARAFDGEPNLSMIGRTLGTYQVVSLLGSGGMGEVYEAHDTKLRRSVAIKALPSAFLNDPERLSRFQREARVLASLNHPNIATIHGLEQSGKVHYLVMELVPGKTLAERIATGALPQDEALKIASQIAEALEAAHEKGVIHRDLKPANVKVTPQGHVKVLDFGLAKAFANDGGLDLSIAPPQTGMASEDGIILGTPAYMSPEQARGKPVDRRTDIWAFGCVLYELLSGIRAFRGDTSSDSIAAVIEKEPDWKALPDSTPGKVLELLRRCLRKDPQRRLRDIGDARIEIEDSLAASGTNPALTAPAKRVEQRALVLGLVTLLAIVLAGLVIWGAARFQQLVSDTRVLRLSVEPPEGGAFFFGTSIGGVALSPDGKTAAYVATVKGQSALWVRRLDEPAARMLPGTERAFYPFWSPDSKSLAFFTPPGRLSKIDIAGGTPFTICDSATVNGRGGGRGGVWTDDGQIIFAIFNSGLYRVPASGGTPSPLTTVDKLHGELDHRWPQVLPGGRLLFWIRGDKLESTGVYATSLSKPNERIHILTSDSGALYAPGAHDKKYLLWQRDSKLVAQEFNPDTLKLLGEFRTLSNRVATAAPVGLLVAAVSTNGLLLYSSATTTSQLTWFDRTGTRLSTLGDPGEYENFSLSPDGTRVSAARAKPGGADLWILDTERGVASRLTDRPGNNNYPLWSPRASAIVFRSVSSLARELTNGSGDVERLTESTENQYPTDWSRDGKLVIYYEGGAGTGSDVWVLPVNPDGKPREKPRLYLRTQFNELMARFSPEPNPRWVAYSSDESGRPEIYIDSFPEPRDRIRISTDGGMFPAWSPNGHELFYVSRDEQLMAVSLKIGADSIEASAPRSLFALPVFENGYSHYEVSRDGRRFLILALPEGQTSQPLSLISNWPGVVDQQLSQ
jgi:Tol biopolymer transport system component